MFNQGYLLPVGGEYITVYTGVRMFRTKQGIVLLVCGIGVICAVPSGALTQQWCLKLQQGLESKLKVLYILRGVSKNDCCCLRDEVLASKGCRGRIDCKSGAHSRRVDGVCYAKQ